MHACLNISKHIVMKIVESCSDDYKMDEEIGCFHFLEGLNSISSLPTQNTPHALFSHYIPHDTNRRPNRMRNQTIPSTLFSLMCLCVLH